MEEGSPFDATGMAPVPQEELDRRRTLCVWCRNSPVTIQYGFGVAFIAGTCHPCAKLRTPNLVADAAIKGKVKL